LDPLIKSQLLYQLSYAPAPHRADLLREVAVVYQSISGLSSKGGRSGGRFGGDDVRAASARTQRKRI
jgi:hypothetical protein